MEKPHPPILFWNYHLMATNSSIYAKIRYEIACDNFLNLFFFNYPTRKTRFGKSSANTTNKGEEYNVLY
jgi:hypothetical protein